MTKKSEYRRFSDFDDYEEGVNSFEELVGEEIIIHSVRFNKGDFGTYAEVEYSLDGDETILPAQTGAKQIVAELRKRSESGDLPLLCEVKRIGRALRIG